MKIVSMHLIICLPYPIIYESAAHSPGTYPSTILVMSEAKHALLYGCVHVVSMPVTAGVINGGFLLFATAKQISAAASGRSSFARAFWTSAQCAGGLAAMAYTFLAVMTRGVDLMMS
jgi:hypothetical protein